MKNQTTEEMENNQFKPLRDLTSSAVSSSASVPSPTCQDETANRRAAILLGCYRKGDAEDPETYAAAVASILAEYPMRVVYRVTDPRSGLPGKSQWLPTVAEIKAACEAEMAPLRAEEARARRRAHTANILTSIDNRVSPEQWAALAAKFPNKAARKIMTPEELKAYGHQPLTVSDAFKAHIKPQEEPSEEIWKDIWGPSSEDTP